MPPWPPGRPLARVRRTGSAHTHRAASARRSSRGPRGAERSTARHAKPARRSGPEVRAGETLLDLRMPAAYRPSAPKGVDRRLPLLPPRPEAGERRVGHVGADRAGSAEGRAPRDPVPRRADAGRRRAKGLDSRGLRPGLVVLRRNRASPPVTAAGFVDSLNDANWVAAWAPGWGGNRLPDGTGVPLPAGQPDRDAGSLQPAERQRAGSLARASHGRARIRRSSSR